MSRHRSPGGRNAHQRPEVPAVALPGAPPGRVRHAQHRAASAVHNGMSAAAASGAALAIVIPTMGAATGPVADIASAQATTLRLTSDGRAIAPAGESVRLVASIVPVSEEQDAEPPAFDVTELLKGAGLADVARQAQEQQLAREAAALCDAELDGLGRVKPWARDAAGFLSCLYDEPTLIGVANRSRASDHPRGLAVDLMSRGEQGDRIADCALANRDELGISYVIWEQRINYGDGWERMPDRGGDTENHVDHVHVSFESSPGSGDPLAERCG